MTISERKIAARMWAEGIIEKIQDDPRPYVIKDTVRPITDLKDMMTTSTKLFGDKVAFLQVFPGSKEFKEITYEQTFLAMNALGTKLLEMGLKDKRVAVIGSNSYQWSVSYLAVACGVGIVVPMDKELPAQELRQQIERAEVSCVLCDKKTKDIFKEILEAGDTTLEYVINLDTEAEKDGILSFKETIEQGKALLDEGKRDYLDAEIDYEALGVMLFTSGTTGTSKCVMLSHKNLATQLMTAPSMVDMTGKDRYFSLLPFHHTYECSCCMLMALSQGASIAFCRGLKYIVADMQATKPTIMLSVPALMEKLYSSIWKNVENQGKTRTLVNAIKVNNQTKNMGKNLSKILKRVPDINIGDFSLKENSDKLGYALSNKFSIDMSQTLFKEIHKTFGGRMKTLICGASAINPEVLEGFQSFGINAIQGYGLTECAPLAAVNPSGAPKAKSVGPTLPSMEVKLVDVNEEGIGEICSKGDQVMLGYYKMEDETEAVIDDEGWFHTGDLGYIDEDGYVYISGRKKNVIITKNGKNVYPEELEYLLSKASFISECYVFEDSKTNADDTIIVASVILDEEVVDTHLGVDYTDEEAKELIWKAVDIMNETAPSYRKIKRIILRKTPFVKNSTQKIVRFDDSNKLEI